MKAILIFDTVNDLIFAKWDETFIQHMKNFNSEENGQITDIHSVSQLLSPIVTSQRVMAAQFGNTYSSMQCKDNTTIVFDEWLDHVFLIVSKQYMDDAQRELMDCKTLVQHVCGQNINLLHSPLYQDWLSVLLESRGKGESIPGANGLIGESGATSAALNALKTVAKEVKCSPYNRLHFLLYVGNKLLALYSSRGSEDLTPPDIILLSIQCVAAQEFWLEQGKAGTTESVNVRLPWLSEENSAIIHMCAGAGGPCAPHSMHLAQVAPRICFVILADMDMREVGIAAQMSNQILSNLRRLLLQRNLELLPNTLDSLEVAVKKTTDALRKQKSQSSLISRLNARMTELRKSCGTTTPLTPETAAAALHTALDAVSDFLKPDIPSLRVQQPLKELTNILTPYVEFLTVKAMRSFSMGSWMKRTRCRAGSVETEGSLTLHKYVDEFPGLVHFVYVDRTAGRYLAPDIADCADMITPQAVNDAMRRWLRALHCGYVGATWRRGAVHVCAVVWYSRRQGPAAPPAAPHPALLRAAPPPGDITGAFYKQLQELAFPNESAGVSVKEVLCMHLGLVPAATAVAQARRLAHAVHSLTADNPAAAADLI